jgi:energy-coupling factor transporter transmembrane protein EcfT
MKTAMAAYGKCVCVLWCVVVVVVVVVVIIVTAHMPWQHMGNVCAFCGLLLLLLLLSSSLCTCTHAHVCLEAH